MNRDQVSELVEYFAHEHPEHTPARTVAGAVRSGQTDAREALHALLTIREPAPIRADMAAKLDRLLSAETAQRGSIDALTLPKLSATHSIPGLLGERVALWQGDLTMLRAGAVVNAANSRMLGCFVPEHRCIDKVLGAAAGPGLRAECAEYMASRGHQLEPTGSAILTGGYHLPADHVIHTVGPIVADHEPTPADAAALASSYRSIVTLAETSGLASVGLCSVSTGVFGYPKDQAALVVLDTIDAWLASNPSSNLRIVITAFAAVDVAAYSDALASREA